LAIQKYLKNGTISEKKWDAFFGDPKVFKKMGRFLSKNGTPFLVIQKYLKNGTPFLAIQKYLKNGTIFDKKWDAFF
jgi:hypothetical protein